MPSRDDQLSEKERALLEASRREVAAKSRPRKSETPRGAPAGPAPAAFSDEAFPATVIGWDHPAAQGGRPDAPGGAEKWSRIAAMMEGERREAQERRRKLQRGAITVLVVLLVAVLLVGARVLAR